MVRAVKLESTPSGSYYNASQGVFWTVGGVVTPPPVTDTTAPTVAITAPVGGSTVTNAIMVVSANAADNLGVVGVQFKLDGANMGAEVLIAPFSKAWNMTDVSVGQHTLTAVARDLAGNQTTATAVSFTVPAPSTGGGSSGGSTNTTGTVVWVDNALPAGATGSGDGGDTWNWVSNPTPYSGTVAHQSAIASGLHQHYFDNATATMSVAAGDKLFAYVYLDPANPPSELMLQWTDGSWEHRAYWGANTISYGTAGTVSRYNAGALPATGQWVRLEVPASAVGLEGKTVKGMAFTAFGGRVTWDYAGKTDGSATTPPTGTTTVTVTATDASASVAALDAGVFTVTRSGATTSALTVNLAFSGTATNGVSYNTLPPTVTIPAGSASATITLTPKVASTLVGTKTATLTAVAAAGYSIGANASADVVMAGNAVPIQFVKKESNGMRIAWNSTVGKTYRVLSKNNLTDTTWTQLSGSVSATSTATGWLDTGATPATQRFYMVYVTN
jgi:hypothetical protein